MASEILTKGRIVYCHPTAGVLHGLLTWFIVSLLYGCFSQIQYVDN